MIDMKIFVSCVSVSFWTTTPLSSSERKVILTHDFLEIFFRAILQCEKKMGDLALHCTHLSVKDNVVFQTTETLRNACVVAPL